MVGCCAAGVEQGRTGEVLELAQADGRGVRRSGRQIAVEGRDWKERRLEGQQRYELEEWIRLEQINKQVHVFIVFFYQPLLNYDKSKMTPS